MILRFGHFKKSINFSEQSPLTIGQPTVQLNFSAFLLELPILKFKKGLSLSLQYVWLKLHYIRNEIHHQKDCMEIS